jgi:hypothetical protein
MIGQAASPCVPRWVRTILVLILTVSGVPGCALSWRTADGSTHVLGFAHLILPPVGGTGGTTGRLQGVDATGIVLVRDAEGTLLAMGHLRRRLLSVGDDIIAETNCFDCMPRVGHHVTYCSNGDR